MTIGLDRTWSSRYYTLNIKLILIVQLLNNFDKERLFLRTFLIKLGTFNILIMLDMCSSILELVDDQATYFDLNEFELYSFW